MMTFFQTAKYLALAASLTAPQVAVADTTLVYFGGGLNNDGATVETDDPPFVLGFIGTSDDSPLVLGVDIAAEGEMLDSTYGGDEVRQAYSFNGLIGTNLIKSSGFRTDASLLLGFRESFADCPDSFIGFQCYADQEPDTDYEFNYGAVVNFTVDQFTFGVRATEVSTQAIIGFAF